MPTPLYVTQDGRKIILRYETQEEADAAYRILSALAAMHADHINKLREQGEHVGIVHKPKMLK